MNLPVTLPPDPEPSSPSWRLPNGATDTHFHVFGPPDRFPFASTRRYEPQAAPFERWQALADTCGIERGIVVQPTAHGADNAAILEAVARAEGRLRAVAMISHETPLRELQRLADAGVVGARFSLMSDRPGGLQDIARALPSLQRMNWSLDLHIEPDALLANESFIRSIPVPVVIDHMARIRPRHGLKHPATILLLDLLRDENFWVKLSCANKISEVRRTDTPPGRLPYEDVIPLARAVIDAAPGRALWGSDWPHGNNFDPGNVPSEGALLDLLADFAPDHETRTAILVDNPARLYGLG